MIFTKLLKLLTAFNSTSKKAVIFEGRTDLLDYNSSRITMQMSPKQ